MEPSHDKELLVGFEDDRQQELLMDALEGMAEIEPCSHTPDTLEFWDWEYGGDKVTCIFRCGCGKIVKEIFTHLDTRISN